MIGRVSGVILACMIGLPLGQAAAQQPVYPYPPRAATGPYAEDVLPGYDERAPRRYARRLPAGYGDDDYIVIDGRRYYRSGVYNPRGYARRYYRVVPGAYYDDDPPPARPFFQGRSYSRSIPEDDGTAFEDAPRYGSRSAPAERNDRYAGLPPAAAPEQRALPRLAPDESPAYEPPSGPEGKAGPTALAPHLRRQAVPYAGKEPAGTIIVDTRNTYLYYVLGNGEAMRYGIGVGREGFTWTGREKVSRMAEWPDWYPPQEMIERQPYLPRMMAGGPGNPLGARALYLGSTLYRIHGTNDPATIGKYVSSGCIRLLNEDVEDLYNRVHVGTKVVVLPGGRAPAAASASARR